MHDAGSCRFTWAVQYFVGAGFYVIPSYSPADFSVDNTVVSTPALFLRNWANLWTAITEVASCLSCSWPCLAGPGSALSYQCVLSKRRATAIP